MGEGWPFAQTYHAYILIAPLMAGACFSRPVCPSFCGTFLRAASSAQFVGAGKLYGGHRQRGVRAGLRQFHAVSPWACRLLCWFRDLIARCFAESGGPAKLLNRLLFRYIMPVAGTVLLINLLFSESGLQTRCLRRSGFQCSHGFAARRRFDPHWNVPLKSTGYSGDLVLCGLVTIPRALLNRRIWTAPPAYEIAGLYHDAADVVLRVFRRDIFGDQRVQCFREIFS